MRIHIKGTDKYSFVDVEYDVLLSTPVMNVKVRIMVTIYSIYYYYIESILNSAH